MSALAAGDAAQAASQTSPQPAETMALPNGPSFSFETVVKKAVEPLVRIAGELQKVSQKIARPSLVRLFLTRLRKSWASSPLNPFP